MAAGTTTPIIKRAAWTQIQVGGTSGLIQNICGEDILVREQVADPGTEEDHGKIYAHREGDPYVGTVGLWVRIAPGGGQLNESLITLIEW